MKKDFYELLGVSKGADERVIKKAYYKLAKKYHPDTNPYNKVAEQKFKEISEAYDILSDPEKRKLYDAYGMAAFDGSMNMSPGNDAEGFEGFDDFGGFHGFKGFTEFRGFDSFKGFDTADIFNHLFGRRDSSAQNMTANITVSKMEAACGCEKLITIRRPQTSKFSVKIPAGIKEGQKIRLKGKGHRGHNGMPDGDLFLKVHIA